MNRRLAAGRLHFFVNRCRGRRVLYADSLDQLPRQKLVDEKLGLLAFFRLWSAEVCALHGGPIHLIEIRQVRIRRGQDVETVDFGE